MGTLKVRVGDAWEVVGAGTSEVLVSDVDPYVLDPDATEELWYSPMVKQLFARVNGEWRIATPNEVMVSRNDPALINPEVEVWYDPDASPSIPATKPVAIDEAWIGGQEPVKPTVELWLDTTTNLLKARVNGAWVPITIPPELPVGGLVNEALVKNSGADQETRWGGALTVPGVLTANGGINSYGQLGMGAGERIQFPNEVGPKIYTYAQTFGIGVESGEACMFGSSKVGFRQNASNGAYFGYVDANTGGGLIIDRDNCDARYAPIAANRANSVFAPLGDFNLTGSYVTIHNASFNYPNGNRRIKVTVQLHVIPGGSQHVLIKCFGQETSWEKMASITDTIGPAVFVGDGTGTYKAVMVEVKTDTGNGAVEGGSNSSWILVEDLGPR